jgi:dienelactone hydrolase
MKRILGALALAASILAARAAIHSEAVEYADGDNTFEGWLAYDDANADKRAGILVVHQGLGLGQLEKEHAEALAALGYTAFAVDIYGKGVRPANSDAATEETAKYRKDRALYRSRMNRGLKELLKQETVDPKRVAAIGYSFGGMGAIELARSGAEVAAVVTFHGSLDSPNPGDGANIKAKVLALHGADDPQVKAADLEAFCNELRTAKVDWQLISYGGAVHNFTDKGAGDDNSTGLAYNERADKRSWEAMKTFLKEVLSSN